MLILRNIKRIQKGERLFFYKWVHIRFLSGEISPESAGIEAVTRKFSKPLLTKEAKRMNNNFVLSLYAGEIEKSIFEYPTVLQAADYDKLLDHSVEVERFLQNTPKDQPFEDIIKELKKLELFGLSIPQKYGGAGYNETERQFIQECTGNNSAIGRFLGYNENFGCKIINLYGTEEQKQKYLPGLAQGKSFISLAYLENGPLSDLSKIEGYVINDELNKTYILSAEKKWVHYADKADLFLVMVKTPRFFYNLNGHEEQVQVKLNFFICERNTPGITVHKLKSEYAQENNLFDVSFKDVVLQQGNYFGSLESDGGVILKTALSHNNITDAALCCNMIKHIAYDATHFINERKLCNPSVQEYNYLQENLATLVIYLYALESVIYLVTGRFDTYENPDLFNESIFAKVLAIDILKIAIKKYTDIFGRESFKSPGLLEEAIKTMQYYTAFDENIEYLKMMCSAEALVHVGVLKSRKVKHLRNPFDHSWEFVKWRFAQNMTQGQSQKFKLELQQGLSPAANTLEESYKEFQWALENFFIEQGKRVIQNEHALTKFADMAVYIYASLASLSRASSSLCYDFNDCQIDLKLASAFTLITKAKIKELITHEIQHSVLITMYKDLGKEILNRKGYPLEHPLSRTL